MGNCDEGIEGLMVLSRKQRGVRDSVGYVE